MSEKKNTKKEQQNNEATEKKKLGKKGILAIILSSVALVGIIVGIIVGVAVNKNKEFDYNKAKLSKYVSVPERLYKSYNVTLNIPEITDFDVEEEVVKVLCANKITPDGPIYSLPGIAISAGDIARIYYRGYTMEGDVKKYFDGGCNFASDPADTELEIGSGTFVPGFESGLIGEDGVGKATLTRAESGKVRLGDIISLTYSVSAEHRRRIRPCLSTSPIPLLMRDGVPDLPSILSADRLAPVTNSVLITAMTNPL